MLSRLIIHNYLLIRQLDIGFDPGFSVITGETGSGKSILLGALGLILGQRADAGVLWNKDHKCIIEGHFNVREYRFEALFTRHDLDPDDTLIIRREINPAGKSRAFINDTPVGLSILKEFGDQLVNIHSQHSILTLNEAAFQLRVLDDFAGLLSETAAYRQQFRQYSEMKERLAVLKEKSRVATEEQDYLAFLFRELEDAHLNEGEYAELDEKMGFLQNAEEIRSILQRAGFLMSGEESDVLSRLSEVIRDLSSVGRFNTGIKTIQERLQANYIDLKDVAGEISHMADTVEVNPEEMERVSRRLDMINRLLRKHHVNSEGELINLKKQIEGKITGADNLQEEIATLTSLLAGIESELQREAVQLSQRRKQAAPGFEATLTALLGKLGMPRARFSITFTQTNELNSEGYDKIRYMFSANRGTPLRSLSETASGGELSRLMLAVKSMISDKKMLPTIIFDEIDNGVSGETAGRVGAILQEMGSGMQVIAITHLPQISGKGTAHYLVKKVETAVGTETLIIRLNKEERTEEIARMLSNEVVTDAARTAAGELMGDPSPLP